MGSRFLSSSPSLYSGHWGGGERERERELLLVASSTSTAELNNGEAIKQRWVGTGAGREEKIFPAHGGPARKGAKKSEADAVEAAAAQ